MRYKYKNENSKQKTVNLPDVLHFPKLGNCFYEIIDYKKPEKGEYYLSGAIVTVWECFNNLNDYFIVVKPTYYAEQKTVYIKTKPIN